MESREGVILGNRRGEIGEDKPVAEEHLEIHAHGEVAETMIRYPKSNQSSPKWPGGKRISVGTQDVNPAIELWVLLVFFKSNHVQKQSGTAIVDYGVGIGWNSQSRLPSVTSGAILTSVERLWGNNSEQCMCETEEYSLLAQHIALVSQGK